MANVIRFTGSFVAGRIFRPIHAVSLIEDSFGKCGSITLWHLREPGLTITSKMYDVAAKLEVGVLDFEETSERSRSAQRLSFEPPLTPISGAKLIVREGEFLLESGLKLLFNDGGKLLITPADFPCFLAVTGNRVESALQRTEYSLDKYQSVDLPVQVSS